MSAEPVGLPAERPILCLVTDPRVEAARLPAIAAAAVEGGLALVQLRLPGVPAAALAETGRAILGAIGTRARLVVNDRIDVARAIGAAGVQLGEQSLAVRDARAILGPGRLVGRSVHSLAGALTAARDGADYLILGTIYPTGSHPGEPGAGPALVREVCRAVAIPVIAIGGISADNMGEIRRAGAAGAAVISAILDAPDPAAATRRLIAAWNDAR